MRSARAAARSARGAARRGYGGSRGRGLRLGGGAARREGGGCAWAERLRGGARGCRRLCGGAARLAPAARRGCAEGGRGLRLRGGATRRGARLAPAARRGREAGGGCAEREAGAGCAEWVRLGGGGARALGSSARKVRLKQQPEATPGTAHTPRSVGYLYEKKNRRRLAI